MHDKTGNMRGAQELAGHSSMSTTGDNYTEFTEAALGDLMREVLT